MVQTQAFFQLVGDARRSKTVYRNSVLQSCHKDAPSFSPLHSVLRKKSAD